MPSCAEEKGRCKAPLLILLLRRRLRCRGFGGYTLLLLRQGRRQGIGRQSQGNWRRLCCRCWRGTTPCERERRNQCVQCSRKPCVLLLLRRPDCGGLFGFLSFGSRLLFHRKVSPLLRLDAKLALGLFDATLEEGAEERVELVDLDETVAARVAPRKELLTPLVARHRQLEALAHLAHARNRLAPVERAVAVGVCSGELGVAQRAPHRLGGQKEACPFDTFGLRHFSERERRRRWSALVVGGGRQRGRRARQGGGGERQGREGGER